MSSPVRRTSPNASPDVRPIPGLRPQNGFRFRAGQRAFLEKWADALDRGERNVLGVFVPGYGKTLTALASYLVARERGVANRLVVFVPRGNLRDQYADAEELAEAFHNLGAAPISFCIADSDQVFLKNLDTEFVVTTYQYAAGETGNKALRRYCRQAKALFVFDEVHHLADDGTWAQAVDRFPHAASVALSGTPVRSDNKTLFGVPFTEDDDGVLTYEALHEVTMGEAHEEGGILKQVDVHVVDYTIQMVRGDTGEEVQVSLGELRETASSSSEVDTYLARRKLRFHEVYLETLLGPAFEVYRSKRGGLARHMARTGQLLRGGFRDHQMLVIAMSNRHAAAILAYIRHHVPDVRSARVGQDVPAATREKALDAYRRGDIDVMVQVDMIGEGTDIKPISVIVKADLVRAASKTMQQVFRGMRYVPAWPEEHNRCDLFAAGDSDVVETLRWIASEEQRGVKKRKASEGGDGEPPAPPEPSVWELKSVRQGAVERHSLEQMQRRIRSSRDFHKNVPKERKRPAAIDVQAKERELRRECHRLAMELSHALSDRGMDVHVREIHQRAKDRLFKAQENLSIRELTRKRSWLTRCLRARRLL